MTESAARKKLRAQHTRELAALEARHAAERAAADVGPPLPSSEWMLGELAELANDLRARAARSRNHASGLHPADPEAVAARGKARGFDEAADAASRLIRVSRQQPEPKDPTS